MSGHLIGCVKRLTGLPKGHKLGLVAFADSADDRTHIGFPGPEGVMDWADVGRSQAFDIIRDLVEWGYLRQHKRGHRGQRAEYVVFPGGCCDLHRAPVEEPDVDVAALAKAAGVDEAQARLMLAALGSTLPAKESSPAGPNHEGKGPASPDPIDREHSTPGDNPGDDPRKGPESVRGSRSTPDAFTTSTTPLTPASGGTGCARHPNSPGANCRGCGTTQRQRADAQRRAAAEARRLADQAETARARAARELAAPPPAGLRGIVAAAAAEEARRTAERARMGQ